MSGGAAALLVLGAVGYYALTDNGPRLSGQGNRLGLPPSVAHAPFVVADFSLCLDQPGTVTVTGVRPVRSEGGLAIRGFAVRPWVGGSAMGGNGTLAAAGYHPERQQTVSIICTADSKAQLAVQVEHTGNETATLDGLTVDYLSDGYRHTVDIPGQATVCAFHDQQHSDCGRSPQVDWSDPASAMAGEKILASTGRRTGDLQVPLPGKIPAGTTWVTTECQGTGTLVVDAGPLGSYTEPCSDRPDGSDNAFESPLGTTANLLKVTADPGVTWAVAIGWDSSQSHPQ
ncbi:hypothetical protein [Streptacidiphilus rugosus]|uniref:hypothetical protein n=1 Tax=Streptacidiphilus rugosus TaxID=405783 RepID=UPI0005649509|nr:hypothetical protein [Streptacidiphilus rugosus]